MLRFVKTYIIEGKTSQALEIFEVNGKEYFALLVLENRKGELELVTEHLVETFDRLLVLIEKKMPLFVTFNTPKVLKKQITTKINDSSEVLVVNAFPNLELDNFYYQLLKSKDRSVVSISKKDHINGYLEQFDKAGLQPFQIALGISTLQALEGFSQGAHMGSNFKVQLSQTVFEAYENVSELEAASIRLNGITFQNSYLLGFTQILGFLQQKGQPSNLTVLNQNLYQDFKNQKWFNFGIRFGLGLFLVLLLTNFLVFNHYHENNLALEAGIATTQNQDGSLKALQQRITNKEDRLASILNSKSSQTSYYLDELGKSMPSSIYLNDIQYQPLATPVRDGKSIDLVLDNLLVSGVTNEKIQFTVWSDNLEMQKWVEHVEIMDYEYLSKSSANFTLKVILNQND